MISLLGLCLDYNSSHLRGPAAAPDMIRMALDSGSMNHAAENRLDIMSPKRLADMGNIVCDIPETGFNKIIAAIDKELSKGRKVISLGGDHSVTYPILQAYGRHYEPPTIIHFDAHPDLYDNFEDNPHSHASPFARIMEQGLAKRLIQIGIRTINDHQQDQIERFGVEVIEARHFHIDKFRALNIKGPVYISMDMDALDPAFAPGVSHHEPGGLTTRNVIDVLQSIEMEVIGGDIVEYNPRKDIHDMTAYVAAKILKEMAAAMID